MTGRRRLTWVTALTVASLLVGSSALSALADGGRDGSRHGNGGQGNDHAQNVNNSSGWHGGEGDGGGPHIVHTATTPSATHTSSDHHGDGDDQDEHEHNHGTPT